MPPLWIRGEVVQFKAWPGSGHWYFNLRDRNCQVRCCMWSRDVPRRATPLRDGTEVFVLGQPAIYEAKGEFQLKVTTIIPDRRRSARHNRSWSACARCSRRTASSIRRESARYRGSPRTIAVVTSVAGAALRDIITVVRNRWPCGRVRRGRRPGPGRRRGATLSSRPFGS